MSLFSKKKPSENLDMKVVIPKQNVTFEIEEDNTVTLLKPKFTSDFSLKYIVPRMKYPYYKIHLDEIGTAVWNAIDGKRTAYDIGEMLNEKLGDKIEPVYERLGFFLAKMKNEKFIEW
jgi:hypothetical protein